jgi:O-antigen/teichoic acid export membrane protein
VSESPLKRLLVHTSHYSIASFFTAIAGLVSFPLMTRIFSVEQYGQMNLIAATLTIAVSLGKVGVQHAIIRQQSEIRAGKSTYTDRQFFSTTLLGMTGTAVVAMLVLAVGAQLAPANWLGDPKLRLLFLIAGAVVVAQVLESALLNFARADNLTTLQMKYQVIKKYAGLALILAALLLVSKSLFAFYWATLVIEVSSVLLFAYALFRGHKWPTPSRADYSRPLHFNLLKFGIPMMIGYELAGIILSVGDRYVINGMIGEASVGLYSASYNLCQYVQSVVISSVGQAVIPLYTQMWDRKGAEAAAEFISRSLRSYVLLGAPVVAGLASVGPELLPSLASEKYLGGAVILPWVIAGMVVEGAIPMVGAGLFIQRRTRTIMTIVTCAALLNILLNVILVPRLGIVGAAVATLVSYGMSATTMLFAGRRVLAVKLPWLTLVRASMAAGVMYVALDYVLPGRHLLSVAARIAIGGPIYVAAVALTDPDARALLRKGLDKVRGPRPQPL